MCIYLYVNHICLQCSKSFTDPRSKANYCCRECYYASIIGKTRSRKVINCLFCGKEKSVMFHKSILYCSKSCYHQSLEGKKFHRKPPIEKICLCCQKTFLVPPSKSARKLCSKQCTSIYLRGENSSNWQGGKTSKYDKFKASAEFVNWRKAVFERDRYTCQDCGFTNGNGEHRDLHPHHIKSASKYPEFRTDLENGVTLCLHCHGRRHSINFKNKKYNPKVWKKETQG